MRTLALLALVAGCFGQPLEDECLVRCGDGDVCPADYRCGGDGFCHPADLDQPRDCAGGAITCEEAADCGVAEAVCRCGQCAAPDPACTPSGLRTLGDGGDCVAGAIGIAAGSLHTCAVLSDGRAFCWGNNCHGELGNPEVPLGPSGCGDDESSLRPVEVQRGDLPLSGVRAIRPGLSHTCALLDDGTAVCWGSDDTSQLGRGGGGGVKVDPAPVLADGQPLEDLVDLASGWQHSCAVNAAGAIWCWGSNSNGQIGVDDWSGGGDTRSSAERVDTAELFEQVAAGSSHTCALVEGGQARCWGRNDVHQLGDSATCDAVDQPTPVVVLRESDDMELEGASALSAGNKFSCAATAGPDRLLCWGENTAHKVGDDSCPECADGYSVCLARESVLAPASAVARLVTGGTGACALLAGGDLWCWGASDRGQIGVPTAESWLPPTRVMGGTVDVAVGFDHACAIAGSGQVLCWGDNLAGELGTGSADSAAEPTPVAEMCP